MHSWPLLTWLAALARAADLPDADPADEGETVRSPAQQCATAGAGGEIEICLGIAVEAAGCSNTGAARERVDEVAAALIAHVDRAEEPDRVLLDALLLLSTDRAAEGAARLGALDDPRAVPVLLHLAASTADPEVGNAAVSALSGYPGAVPTLREWLLTLERSDERDRAVDLRLRMAVARALGAAGRPDAADVLEDAMRVSRLPPLLKREIVRTLSVYYPERLPPPRRQGKDRMLPSTDGAPWTASTASFGLAYTMGAAGHFGRLELWPIGALTGGVAGSTVGWLWGRAWPYEAGDAATMATLTVGGVAAGNLVGAGLFRDRPGDPADMPLLLGLGGQLVGLGTGLGLSRIEGRQVTPIDALEATAFAGAVAGATELGLTVAAANGSEAPRALWTGTALAAGLAVGNVLGPGMDARRDAGWVANGALLGLAGGLMVPIGEAERGLLPLATAAGGASLGLAVSAFSPPRDLFVGANTGAVFGAGAGIGAGLLASREGSSGDLARGLGLIGMTAGYGVGATVSRLDPDPVDDRDVAIAMTMGGWAAFDAIAIANLAGLSDQRRDGMVVLTTTLATGATSALNIYFDVPVPHTLSATSVGLWGGYAGAAIGELVEGIDPFALALPLSNVGFVGSFLLVSPLVGAPPLVIGIADTGGVFGATISAITVGFATGDRRAVVLSSLAGGGAGFLAGAILGERWRVSTEWERRDIALGWPGGRRIRGPSVSVAPLVVRGGTGLSLAIERW